MDNLETFTLKNIFEQIDFKINKLKKIIDKFNNLELKIDTDNIKKLSIVSNNLNEAFDNLKDIYYHILENNENVTKSQEEKEIIKNNNINSIIQKTFLPYMMLMRIKLENEYEN